MKLIVKPGSLNGDVPVPTSKSHTIRALVIAMLSDGESEIIKPLDSLDTRAAVDACRMLGAEVDLGEVWRVRGVDAAPCVPDNVIDVANSGTTINFMLSASALVDGAVVLTGDASIRKRSSGVLLEALRDLGAEAFSTRGDGRPPFVVRGLLSGGRTELSATSSQYLSSLLISCPLSDGTTEIDVAMLNEAPYVNITLDWLTRQGIELERDGLKHFRIPGGQKYKAFKRRIPGDFSSATFFAVAAAVTDSKLRLLGLDMKDHQGDKEVIRMVEAMGANVDVASDVVSICRGELKGGEFDLNATPDALPAMAVAAALATGESRLVNVAQARDKETDRITVMAEELAKMGADVRELDDGLVIRGGKLKGAHISGHHDHRIVMAFAVAGLAAEGETVIDTAESAAVTFPGFVELMTELGADVRLEE